MTVEDLNRQAIEPFTYKKYGEIHGKYYHHTYDMLIVIAIKDNKVRVYTGESLDEFAIVREDMMDIMTEEFKSENYVSGCIKAIDEATKGITKDAKNKEIVIYYFMMITSFIGAHIIVSIFNIDVR